MINRLAKIHAANAKSNDGKLAALAYASPILAIVLACVVDYAMQLIAAF